MRFTLSFSLHTLCLVLCSAWVGLAQAQYTEITDDFEGAGTIDTWTGDDCQLETAFANPLVNADNPSSTVLRYADTGGTYANVYFTNIENYNMTTGTTFSLKVYVPSSGITGDSPNQISLKLQNGYVGSPWATQSEIVRPLELDQWQTLTFDFSSGEHVNYSASSADPDQRVDFNRVLLQINGENNGDQVVAYIDDFVYDGLIGYDPDDSDSVFDVLVWSDEFDTDGALDDSKWFHQTQLPNSWGWFNGELQHYTDEITNSFAEDGFLNLVAIQEDYTDQGLTTGFTSARLNSKFAFTYGRVEARAKMPFGVGTWPAIWMLGKNISEAGGYWYSEFGTTGWPYCGEIDIMEHWGWNQNYVSAALHTPSSSGATINTQGLVGADVSDEFHIYGMEWDEEEIRFMFDGQVYYVYHPAVQNAETWPYFEDQYLLLNVAIQEGIDANFDESAMVVDYIRVYQNSSISVEEENPEMAPFITARLQGDDLLIQNGSEQSAQLSIYDMQGRMLMAPTLITPGAEMISLRDFSGPVVLQFAAGGMTWGEKIIR